MLRKRSPRLFLVLLRLGPHPFLVLRGLGPHLLLLLGRLGPHLKLVGIYSVLVCEGHANMLLTLFLMLMLSDECHVTLICAVGSCSEGTCQHPRSTKWVQCEVCGDWYHCLCANVDCKTAEQDSYVFCCILCKLE